ncbi:unnamed protein product [Cyprideis torosa]|uniref:Uncharacterized protein n=1 Tax=Cyprideis torosa TaxID=163714 RepID=A0A7R8ZUL8_9CRUS|nr:unnamed protein product [Cyprideis torosa]CAG0906275.1 unnamed protein product [Cyprideis torosa]
MGWATEVRRKRHIQFQRIRKKLSTPDGTLMTPARHRIVSLSICQLLDELQEGKILPTEVLHAYQAKSLECNDRLNCITEYLEEAEDAAAALDHCPTRGPLHGLPISIKENFQLKNHVVTLGLANRVPEPPSEETAVFPGVLVELGCIPFCRTNVPQGMFTWGCSNALFGATKNAHNPSRTAGGSCGGECALVGAGGSPIGLGGDLLGSARIPAHFNGCVSLKVSPDRISTRGIFSLVTDIPGCTYNAYDEGWGR